MKKAYSIRLIIAITVAISFSFIKADYTPKYSNHWKSIDDSIRKNWVNASGICSPSLRDSFAYAFWCGCQFYWDTYFTQLGLDAHNEQKLAKGGINNLLHLVDSLGFAPNANMDWGDNRSQPPYLSMMVRKYYTHYKDKEWLQGAYKILLKEYKFWNDTSKNAIEKNQTGIAGLQRYFHHATNRELLDMFNNELVSRFGFSSSTDSSRKLEIASNFAAEAETGMDFTTRFEGRCPDFVAVDLNSNLYLYEKNFAWMEKELGISDGVQWEQRAQKRKDLINKYCWNKERGIYLDYDFVHKRHSRIASATMFSPLYAGIASKQQAESVIKNINLLESPNGILTTEYSKQDRIYQWDHESVWPPMQSLVIMGLDKYGYKKTAKRIAMKYLDIVAANYLKPNPASYVENKKTVNRQAGRIYEKYTSEGLINDREYKANVMMGWSAGTYAFAFAYINR
jgi:alpha,alpha-trehalase